MQHSLAKIEKLCNFFENGTIPRLENHEVHPDFKKDSRENYLYFTLPCAINFQRSSPALWQSALNTYNDRKTKYLFYPEKVIKTPNEKVKKDLAKYNLAAQRNRHSLVWYRLCKTLHDSFNDDPRVLIAKYNSDVLAIFDLLASRKKDFPCLSGPKISNYWLYIITLFTDAKLKNLQEISIIPDSHVVAASKQLKIVDEKATPDIVAKKWKEILTGTGKSPMEFHSVLWHWSRAKFEPKV